MTSPPSSEVTETSNLPSYMWSNSTLDVLSPRGPSSILISVLSSVLMTRASPNPPPRLPTQSSSVQRIQFARRSASFHGMKSIDAPSLSLKNEIWYPSSPPVSLRSAACISDVMSHTLNAILAPP